MKNIFIILLALCSVSVACKNKGNHVAVNETEENIYRCADSMLSAFKRHDWSTFARYNHPTMMKMMGGQESFASFIAQQMKQIPDTAIKRIETGKILQVVTTNKDQQCVVEQNLEMHLEGMKITRTSYLIGESLDNGKNWTFFDGSSDAMPLKNIKPDLSPELKIPAKKQDMQKM